ncbi:hypothetical protein Goshw_026587 [Gossypium schwendimanii]|uniref:Uncharacterized protein n=1 Tax=Gossypium schwendimanii TaxID=34291 RepID=A0A7J9N6P0_GOSSC|nr:hypothetical protein [Gossypium schwendimanii]
MWEDWYAYIPTREPIITPELACMPEYMPWFRIHGKPYLLSPEERQWQLHVQRERCGPLNLRRNNDAGSSTMPRNSPSPSSTPIKSPGPTRAQTQSPNSAIQPMIPTQPPFQMMPVLWQVRASGPVQLHFLLHRVDHQCMGSSSFYQFPPPYGFQTPSPLVMQTPPDSQFYQGESSQLRQPYALLEEPESSLKESQPPSKAGRRRNPALNY